MFIFKNNMNVNSVKISLNELMRLVNTAEQTGKIQEAVSVIEKNLEHLEGSEKAAALSVKEYLKKKLPQTASEVSARVQVEMSSQLNKIKSLFSRIPSENIMNYTKEKPVHRSQSSMLRDNLETNTAAFLAPHGREFWLKNFIRGDLDGLTKGSFDLRFMTSAQRLVDMGVIDDSTLVILHTGHNIPIAKQLMKNIEKLGKVNGVIDESPNCFPKLSKRTENIIRLIAEGKGSQTGLAADKIKVLEEKIEPFKQAILYGGENEFKMLEGYSRELEENAERILSQNYTYTGVMNQQTEGKGAKFLGIDFHRTANYNTSQLPTAQELKNAGIKKVVFLDETPPISTFSPEEAFRIYEPIDDRRIRIIADNYDSMIRHMWSQNIQEGLRAFKKLEESITPSDITEKTRFLASGRKQEIAQEIKNKTFGYSTKQVSREDVSSYLQNLESDMPVIVEGVDLNKLELFSLSKMRSLTNPLIEVEQKHLREKNAFTEIIKYVDNLIKE